jgi:hypothetical protein
VKVATKAAPGSQRPGVAEVDDYLSHLLASTRQRAKSMNGSCLASAVTHRSHSQLDIIKDR